MITAAFWEQFQFAHFARISKLDYTHSFSWWQIRKPWDFLIQFTSRKWYQFRMDFNALKKSLQYLYNYVYQLDFKSELVSEFLCTWIRAFNKYNLEYFLSPQEKRIVRISKRDQNKYSLFLFWIMIIFHYSKEFCETPYWLFLLVNK